MLFLYVDGFPYGDRIAAYKQPAPLRGRKEQGGGGGQEVDERAGVAVAGLPRSPLVDGLDGGSRGAERADEQVSPRPCPLSPSPPLPLPSLFISLTSLPSHTSLYRATKSRPPPTARRAAGRGCNRRVPAGWVRAALPADGRLARCR